MRKYIVTAFLFFIAALPAHSQGDFDFEISKNLDIYSDVYKQLILHYVDDIQPGDLNKTAIDAMLKKLDPYTVYYPESQIEDVRYLRTGKYGGVGASLHIENDTFVVGSVLQGYPFYKAGIRPGDRLLDIDGEALTGLKMSQMSALLKGNAGSSFKLRYQRGSDGSLQQKEITREEIKINNVPWYGFLNDGIGYIKLTQFNETAATEIKNALTDMNKNGRLEGVVLDLRNNGGGLLQQAVQIMDLFLPPGKLIVETRGKTKNENQKYYTTQPALFGQLPVVVLVNSHSASASEIVAGSFQDLDRGIIMGQKSFGKGLVQKVYPLSYNAQMKITIAKYYIPSGRCIQAINYSEHDASGQAVRVADSLRTDFKTENGRPVKDAGGILPDVKTEPFQWPDFALDLNKKFLIFRYANRFAATHDSIAPADDFTITDEEYRHFVDYVKNTGYQYRTPEEKLLSKLARSKNLPDSLKQQFDLTLKTLQSGNDYLFETHKNKIKLLLRQEIVSRYYFDAGRTQTIVHDDREVQQALRLLKNPARMMKILNGN